MESIAAAGILVCDKNGAISSRDQIKRSDVRVFFGLAQGFLFNLAVMGSLLTHTSLHCWRASAIACLVANFQNYILNNSWTYADRSHKGFRKLEGYFSYLLVSAAGLGVTTALYSGFARA